MMDPIPSGATNTKTLVIIHRVMSKKSHLFSNSFPTVWRWECFSFSGEAKAQVLLRMQTVYLEISPTVPVSLFNYSIPKKKSHSLSHSYYKLQVKHYWAKIVNFLIKTLCR